MSDQNDRTDWPDLSGRLTEFGHQLAVRVYYEDTDFSGIVYHASFIRFIERGRSDFIRLLGVHHAQLDDPENDERVAFAVRHMEIDFFKPGKIDDLLIVETEVEEIKGARMILKQQVLCEGVLLFAAKVTVVVINRDGRPRRIPKTLRDVFLS